MKINPILLSVMLLVSVPYARDFKFSQHVVQDVDFTKGNRNDTLYLINLTASTIIFDSIYIDTFYVRKLPFYGASFSTFPIDAVNYWTTYSWQTNFDKFISYSSSKHITLLANDSVGLTNFEFDNAYFPVKRLAKTTISYDTITMKMVFKSQHTCDTLTCIGLITHLPSNAKNVASAPVPAVKNKSNCSFNAKGQIQNQTYDKRQKSPKIRFYK